MKNMLKGIAFMMIVAAAAFLLNSCTSNPDSMADNWAKVVITKNPNDVKGMTQITKIASNASKASAEQTELRQMAQEQIKKAAARLGATTVLIETDSFKTSPINRVEIIGMSYK